MSERPADSIRDVTVGYQLTELEPAHEFPNLALQRRSAQIERQLEAGQTLCEIRVDLRARFGEERMHARSARSRNAPSNEIRGGQRAAVGFQVEGVAERRRAVEQQ